MIIKLKSVVKGNSARIENKTELMEVMINEDILNPRNESIAIGFRNETSSGIVELTPAEFEKVYDAIKGRIHLIKGLKRLYASGAIKLEG